MNLTRVDKLILQSQEHWHLDENDDCYFYGEYTARRGYNFSETNQLIFNFKKGMERRVNAYEWRHKERAIADAARTLRSTLAGQLNIANLKTVTLVPIPPSHAKNDPLYDDRLTRMLNIFSGDLKLDIRELLVQTETVVPSHSAAARPSVAEIAEGYALDKSLLKPTPSTVWLFDDVLTTGAHFKAAKSVVQAKFPTVPCYGIFLARRVPEATEL